MEDQQAEFVDNREQLLREVEYLRVLPGESVIIRIDPSVELEAAGFHEALMQVLADAGLSGRAAVISLPVSKVEFAVVEHDAAGLGRVIMEGTG